MDFTLAGFAVMLPALALLVIVNKRANVRGKGQTVVNVLKMVLAFALGCGMAYTFLGNWLAKLVGLVSGLSPSLKVGFPLALVFFTAGAAVLDIAFDRRADKGAQVAAALAPTFLALVVAGSLGLSGGGAVKDTYQQLHTQVVKLGGKS